ncbi:MAG: extracellular solute-binding protein [Treponema sp.]|nr:extracellular solute-binding protein [Treponema sp.]MCL2271748.1 extracellular solute-binding protein [Treponema sp.]
MKKILLIGLILIAASFAFAGGGKETIEIWHCQAEGDGPAIFNRAKARFEKANPDIKINVVTVMNDTYKQRLAVAMAAGKAPDLFFSWTGGPMFEYVNNNQIVDLTSYMNANPAFRDKLLPAGVAQGTYNGKNYGVPTTNIALATIYYNKEIFQRLNLRVPTTIRELETVCDTLLRNNITPFSLANLTRWTGSMYFMYLATRYGGTQPFIKAVDGSGNFTDPAFIYAGRKISEWAGKNYFIQGFNGLDWDAAQARTPLYRGEAAMLLMGSWFVSQAQSESPDFYAKMGIFSFPRVEEGTGNPASVVGSVGDNFYHVSASSKNPAKAFEFLTFLLDDQGVKEMIADGKIPPVKGVQVTNPISQDILNQVNNAPDVQLWYDQSLSPEVAQVHLITSQELFARTKTPEAAAQELQTAQQAYLRRNR